MIRRSWKTILWRSFMSERYNFFPHLFINASNFLALAGFFVSPNFQQYDNVFASKLFPCSIKTFTFGKYFEK